MEKLKKDMIDAVGVVDWLLTGRPPRGDSTLTRAPVRFARSLGLGQYTQCDASHLPEGDACARLLRVGAAVHRSENHGGAVWQNDVELYEQLIEMKRLESERLEAARLAESESDDDDY